MNTPALIDYWSSVKTVVDKVCQTYDDLWCKRHRVLNSKIILLIILKIVAGDRRQGLSTNLAEFWDVCTDKGINLPQTQSIAASSFCEARQKLSEDIFKDLNSSLLKNWSEQRCLPKWLEHRVFAVDGSRVNIPRELTESGFKIYDKDRRHYPQGLLSCLYDVLSKTVYDFDFVSHMNERKCVIEHLKVLEPNDLVIFDRGYFSYLLLHEFVQSRVHAIFRLQEGTVNKQIQTFIKSTKTDEVIEYIPSSPRIYDLKKQGYNLTAKPLKIRLIKHKINAETYLYGTTLLHKESYPICDLAALYHERWGVEEFYKISKHIIDIEQFHSKTERGVCQEIYAHILLINLSRFFEFDAKDDLPPMNPEDKEKCSGVNFYKFFNPSSMFNLNFRNCLTIVGRYLDNLILGSYALINSWTSKVIAMILRVRQKIRPGRYAPRISYKPKKKWGNNKKKANSFC